MYQKPNSSKSAWVNKGRLLGRVREYEFHKELDIGP